MTELRNMFRTNITPKNTRIARVATFLFTSSNQNNPTHKNITKQKKQSKQNKRRKQINKQQRDKESWGSSEVAPPHLTLNLLENQETTNRTNNENIETRKV